MYRLLRFGWYHWKDYEIQLSSNLHSIDFQLRGIILLGLLEETITDISKLRLARDLVRLPVLVWGNIRLSS